MLPEWTGLLSCVSLRTAEVVWGVLGGGVVCVGCEECEVCEVMSEG